MTGDFREDVYALVGRIPEGRVASYGQLARMAGRPRSARIVGQLMSRSDGRPLPYHRVVKADGSLCEGYEFGVMGAQRELLRMEGVSFLADGRVDMRACCWDGNDQADGEIPLWREPSELAPRKEVTP
ncbi:methylated-DNA--[protein]-cysteine S-methyltransferase [Eubacteriales bacterium OttesenSCG-928-A19]|nr:methylated-DNA--[protein]-cysteine S-methyltransferase [Eubacteriales bacterium OttesenSCG-928-A19]